MRLNPRPNTTTQFLAAMKADEVPEGWSRLWSVVKIMMSKETLTQQHGKPVLCPSGLYTHLYRLTDSTMHLNPPGEVIMVDTPIELKTHLGFVMEAYGNVLVTGLGLGCVARGLLANPRVDHVTCVENSKDVLK